MIAYHKRELIKFIVLMNLTVSIIAFVFYCQSRLSPVYSAKCDGFSGDVRILAQPEMNKNYYRFRTVDGNFVQATSCTLEMKR